MVSMLGCLVVACERLEQPLELNKGRYEIISGVWKSPDEMVDLYVDVVNKHPAIVALLDPFRKEDREQWEALGKAVGSKCYLIADVASRSGSAPTCSGPILRLTNETTVTDLLEAVQPMEGKRGSMRSPSCVRLCVTPICYLLYVTFSMGPSCFTALCHPSM
ncbi:hypothetical protein GDO81_023340 [Engystomops pustulosus]|uniref:phosphopyruvate hydratase n=1 Tax=Engystomops pustulosus TaxID=76066 RepID=A0AAV6YN71_ENGPU|nr:hypothetical protein GDO81_023340 [Engystomops pustulosus]